MNSESNDDSPLDVVALLERHGALPLPPYIARSQEDHRADNDSDRYQTVYAKHPGAVAAPTAGLHFTPELLDELTVRGVRQAFCTLHVGLGTFQPVVADDVRDHVMHEETFEITDETADIVNATRAAGHRVVAVGTTAVRSLESAYDSTTDRVRATASSTRIFIHPPKRLRVVDALVTNFHLPKSTLLLLVSAMASRRRVLDVYAEAIRLRYRFFSYGDAMLVL